MRKASIFIRLALFALMLLPAARLHAASPFDVAGIWAGRYNCQQGQTALELEISVTGPQSLQALFYFHAAPSNPGVPAGCFLMDGQMDAATGRLALHPTTWLLRPFGFVPVGLAGRLTPSGLLLGRVTGPGCSGFVLTRQAMPSAPSPCKPPQGLSQS